VTRQPRDRGVKLFGPFASAGALRGAVQVLQKIFKFRTCSLDIDDGDERWRWFRPCLLASIRQCTAPCNLRIGKEEYKYDIRRLIMFLEGHKQELLDQMRQEMQAAAEALRFEAAARLRDEIQMLERLDRRGEIDTHAQPEVFYIDPKRGLAGLKKVLKLMEAPRTIEGVDIAHLGGGETVASVVQFLDGLPFKPGYRRYKIRGVQGVDDFRSIHGAGCLPRSGDRAADAVVVGQAGGGDFSSRRGGVAQALAAVVRPAAAAVRPRRGPPLCPALPPHPAAQVAAWRVALQIPLAGG
jgi:excinuclease ABC subunit C